jgi:hypothetical protein
MSNTDLMENFSSLTDALKHLVRISAIKEFTICAPTEENPSGNYLIFFDNEDEIVTLFSDDQLRTWLDAYLLGWTQCLLRGKERGVDAGVDAAKGENAIVNLDAESPSMPPLKDGEVIELDLSKLPDLWKNHKSQNTEVETTVCNQNLVVIGAWAKTQEDNPDYKDIHSICCELVHNERFKVMGVDGTPYSGIIVTDSVLNKCYMLEWRDGDGQKKGFYSVGRGSTVNHRLSKTILGDLVLFGEFILRTLPYPVKVNYAHGMSIKRLLAYMEENNHVFKCWQEDGGLMVSIPEAMGDGSVVDHEATWRSYIDSAVIIARGYGRHGARWELTNTLDEEVTFQFRLLNETE